MSGQPVPAAETTPAPPKSGRVLSVSPPSRRHEELEDELEDDETDADSDADDGSDDELEPLDDYESDFKEDDDGRGRGSKAG